VLTAHLAHANPHWQRAGATRALAVFQGADAYVSPSCYPSKPRHGKVVPTWNYEAAHVHGRLTWRHEPEWLLAQVSALSDHHEAPRAQPWAVSDAPADYVQTMLRGIVGLELTIEKVEVNRKLSQNRPEADRQGVIDGLSVSAAETDRQMAAIMSGLTNP
jgi:transcriptional regulator